MLGRAQASRERHFADSRWPVGVAGAEDCCCKGLLLGLIPNVSSIRLALTPAAMPSAYFSWLLLRQCNVDRGVGPAPFPLLPATHMM